MTTVIKHIFVFLTFSILLASCACNDTNNYSREQLEAKPFELYANTTRDLLVGTWIKDTGERKFVIGENDIKAFNKKDEGWERDYGDEYYDWELRMVYWVYDVRSNNYWWSDECGDGETSSQMKVFNIYSYDGNTYGLDKSSKFFQDISSSETSKSNIFPKYGERYYKDETFGGRGNQTKKSKGENNTIVTSVKTIIYKDYLGYEYYFKLLPDGSARFAPTTDPSEIEKLGDIARHEQYLNPEKGYYDKGSNGCLYVVVFDGDTYYVANDGYIYTSYSAWRSRNHDSAFKIISNE